ncbi:unnamed protein product [Paramecium sonneborni]|uniref:Uncharacterized protein n=1 Tax=Paramecium sonneborni TaxID=65129 RepID=A0A8S1PVP5_9CILI|nr:unnamed protein product [Paramecium sonneborni]
MRIIFKDQKIGGGIFDRQGFNVGHWVELSDRFQDKSQFIYHGEYIKGKRFGRWNIGFKKECQKKPEWMLEIIIIIILVVEEYSLNKVKKMEDELRFMINLIMKINSFLKVTIKWEK